LLESQRCATRINNRKKTLNELFLLIQQESPIRKSQIIKRYPHLKKSFHHWIKFLKDKYQVIEMDKEHNYQLHRPVSASVLATKEAEGVLVKNEGDYYQLI
jgi:hypothetical protein